MIKDGVLYTSIIALGMLIGFLLSFITDITVGLGLSVSHDLGFTNLLFLVTTCGLIATLTAGYLYRANQLLKVVTVLIFLSLSYCLYSIVVS